MKLWRWDTILSFIIHIVFLLFCVVLSSWNNCFSSHLFLFLCFPQWETIWRWFWFNRKKKVEVFQGWQDWQWNPVWPQQRCGVPVRTRLRSPTPAIPFFHSTCICCVFLSQCNITRGDVPEHFWWQALPLIVAGSAGSYFFIYLFMHFYLFVFLCGCQAAKAAGGKMNSRAQAGDNTVCWINFTFGSPRASSITVDRHYMLTAGLTCSPSMRPAPTQSRQEDLFSGLLTKQLCLLSVAMSQAAFRLNCFPRRRTWVNFYVRLRVNVCVGGPLGAHPHHLCFGFHAVFLHAHCTRLGMRKTIWLHISTLWWSWCLQSQNSALNDINTIAFPEVVTLKLQSSVFRVMCSITHSLNK